MSGIILRMPVKYFHLYRVLYFFWTPQNFIILYISAFSNCSLTFRLILLTIKGAQNSTLFIEIFNFSWKKKSRFQLCDWGLITSKSKKFEATDLDSYSGPRILRPFDNLTRRIPFCFQIVWTKLFTTIECKIKCHFKWYVLSYLSLTAFKKNLILYKAP